MDAIIQVENIEFSYQVEEEEAPVLLFKDFSLNIERGSFTCILGHNGSGKSSLSRMLNGMVVPARGRVLVNGMDTAKEKLQLDIRKTVGLVFQNPDNQIVSSIVEEDVAFGPENLGLSPEEIRKRVDDALRAVDMSRYATHSTGRLSGGQKQRIAIAGVLAMNPTCLVLDEPTAMLDPKGRKEVLSILHRLNQERGITVVLITHYMEEAALSDRCIVMEKGEILLDGTPADVFSKREVLEQTGLTMPISCKMAYALKDAGVTLPTLPLTEQQCVEALSSFLA